MNVAYVRQQIAIARGSHHRRCLGPHHVGVAAEGHKFLLIRCEDCEYFRWRLVSA